MSATASSLVDLSLARRPRRVLTTRRGESVLRGEPAIRGEGARRGQPEWADPRPERVEAVDSEPPAASIAVTVHIDLRGGSIPPAVARFIEGLHGLADSVATTVDDEAEPVEAPEPEAVAAPPVSGGGSGASLRIFIESRMVLRDGAPIRLTRREYDLLTFLCRNPRRVFSRDQLLRQVWGYEMVGGERTVDVHVRRLRVKLGERGPRIATVRGVGYRMDDVSDVTVVEPTA